MYADIYSLEAPLSAAPGTTIEVALNIVNEYSAPLGLRGIIQYSGPDGFMHDVAYDMPQQSSSTNPGAILPVKGHFTMPNGAVIVYGQSQYWNGGSWTSDQTQTASVGVAQVNVATAPLSATTIAVKLVNPPAGEVSWWPVISLVSNPAEIIQPPSTLGLTDSWTADLSQLGITSSGQCYIEVVAYMSDGNGVGGYSVVFTAKVGDSYTFDFTANTMTDTTSGGSGGGGTPALKVTNTPVSGGQVQFSFSGFTPNTNVLVEVTNSPTGMAWTYVMSDASGSGSGSFTDIDPAGNYTLEAIDNAGLTSPQVPFVLGSSSGGGGGGGGGGGSTGTPTIKVTNSPVSGGPVSFSFSGMTPGSTVEIYINSPNTTVQPQYVTADASGNGSGSFTDDDPAGTYYLATNGGGTPVQTQFTLGSGSGSGGSGGGGTGTPTLTITNSPVSGGKVDFSFSGFTPNTYVSFNINGGLTTVLPFYMLSDASGSGSGSFTDDDPAGTYYLEASDGGTPAQTQFTLGAGSGGGGTTGTGYKGCTEIIGLNVIPSPPVKGASAATSFDLVNLSSTPLNLKGEILVTGKDGTNIPVQYAGGQSGTVNPGISAAGLITADFMTPSQEINITANTYYQDSTGAWVKDQTETLSATPQSGGGSSDTGGSGGSSSGGGGSGSSWASLIPWVIGIAVVAIIVPVLMSVLKKKQPTLPAGRGG